MLSKSFTFLHFVYDNKYRWPYASTGAMRNNDYDDD